ncbi:unnamed protein product [Amaranthus hypochondriacus]
MVSVCFFCVFCFSDLGFNLSCSMNEFGVRVCDGDFSGEFDVSMDEIGGSWDFHWWFYGSWFLGFCRWCSLVLFIQLSSGFVEGHLMGFLGAGSLRGVVSGAGSVRGEGGRVTTMLC